MNHRPPDFKSVASIIDQATEATTLISSHSGTLAHLYQYASSSELDAFSSETADQWETPQPAQPERKSGDGADADLSLENYFSGYAAPGDPTGPGRSEPSGFSLNPGKSPSRQGHAKDYDTVAGSTAVGGVIASHGGTSLSFGSHLRSNAPTGHGFIGPSAPASLSQHPREHSARLVQTLQSGGHNTALGQGVGGSGVGFSGSAGHASASFGGGFNGPATPNIGTGVFLAPGTGGNSLGGGHMNGGAGHGFSSSSGGFGFVAGNHGGGNGGGVSYSGSSGGGNGGHGLFGGNNGGGHGLFGGGGGEFSGSGHGGGNSGGGVQHSGGGGGSFGGSGGGGYGGGSSGGGGHGGGSSGGGGGSFFGGGHGGFGGGDSGHQTPIIHKSAYVYVAPPDEDVPKQKVIIEQPAPKKNYQIVFIKAPNPPKQEVPVIPPLLSPQSDKTLIYVLHPKPEAAPPIHIPAPPLHKPNKPEVYFIRYKTQHHKEESGGGGGSGEGYGGGFGGSFGSGGDNHGFNSNSGGSDYNGFQHVRYGRDQFKKMSKSSEPSSSVSTSASTVTSSRSSNRAASHPAARSALQVKYQKPLTESHPVSSSSNHLAEYVSSDGSSQSSRNPGSSSLSRASSKYTSLSLPTKPSLYNSNFAKLSSHSELSKLPTPHFKPSSKDMFFEGLNYQKPRTSNSHFGSSSRTKPFSVPPHFGGSSSSASAEEDDSRARVDSSRLRDYGGGSGGRHKEYDGHEDEDDGFSSFESETGASQVQNSYMKVKRGQNAH